MSIKSKKNKIKLFLLCSPHNPVGRVWTREELTTLSNICLKHGTFIASDEIHSDIVYAPHRHTVLANVNDAVKEYTIVCTSPSKTFNLAGLQTANIFIPNPAIRKKVQCECQKTGYSFLNIMGLEATKAAYQYGEPWLVKLLTYLENNIKSFYTAVVQNDLPIRLIQPQGTFLLWLDCRSMHLGDEMLYRFIFEKAKLQLHKGILFGKNSSGFLRMNIAYPQEVLQEAIRRIVSAFH